MGDEGLTDGVVALRPFEAGEAGVIIAGRDAAFRRFIGEGSAVPSPEFSIVVEGTVVGWVDHDRDDDRWWLDPDEVNIGYHVFPEHRGRGYATRAVHLMLAHLRDDTEHRVATLLIHPDNEPSLAVAERLRARPRCRGADLLEATGGTRPLSPRRVRDVATPDPRARPVTPTSRRAHR